MRGASARPMRTGRGSARPARRLGPVLVTVAALAAGLAAAAQPPVPIEPNRRAPGQAPAGAEAEPPSLPSAAPLAERLRHNARQRTAEGIAAWHEGRFGDSEAALGRALALAPGAGDVERIDPLGLHNAGTAKLGDGDPAEAARLLAVAADRAAEEGDADLEVDSRYNLGTARYAGGDYSAAVDAFRDVLRRRPGHREAKHNLELALRRLAEQQAGGTGDQPPSEGEGDQQQQQQQQSDEGEGDDRGEQGEDEQPQPEPQAGDESQEPEERSSDGEERPEPAADSPSQERESRLPDFEEQPDMSAEQAASLLDAVESLERQRRRDAAERRARRGAGEHDW